MFLLTNKAALSALLLSKHQYKLIHLSLNKIAIIDNIHHFIQTYMLLRTIQLIDWPCIMAIQNECYHAFPTESMEVMQSKWHISPNSCFVIENNNQVQGYCLAHPWQIKEPPALNQLIDSLPDTVNTLYIHDLALSSTIQGQGAGVKLLNQCKLFAKTHHFDHLSLVAVQGAEQFWYKQGFIEQLTDKSLQSYCNSPKFMVLSLT